MHYVTVKRIYKQICFIPEQIVMKKLTMLLIVSALALTPLASASPNILSTDIPQSSVEGGDSMIVGAKADPASDIDYATARLEQKGQREGLTVLTDRNNDGYYAGALGPVESGNSYSVTFKACTDEGDCGSMTERVEVSCSLEVLGKCLR